MALFRCSGVGIAYSENNPRVEGSTKSYGGNIQWVGSIDNYLKLILKDSDKYIKITTSVPTKGLNNFVVFIDDNQVDTFNLSNKGQAITKTYNLSSNSSFRIQNSQVTSGDVTIQWDYKIW